MKRQKAPIPAITPRISPVPPIVSERSLGEQKVIVILAQFLKSTTLPIPREDIEEKVFKDLDAYIRKMSGGRTWLTGKVTKQWYTLPYTIGHYSISQHNVHVDPSRVTELVQHVIDAADDDVDFAQYPNVMIILCATREDYGMMGYAAYPGMLGWADQGMFETQSGQVIEGGVAAYCQEAHLGVLLHDLLHIIGGVVGDRRVVPCLYDHTLQGAQGQFRGFAQFYLIYMGYWDPMSCHFYGLQPLPPGLSSWTKLRLNWIDPSKIVTVNPGETAKILLDPLEREESETQVIKIPLSQMTYYLVENRQPIGYDRNLPGHGVLILYVDDTISECWPVCHSPVKVVDANPEVEELQGAAFGTEEGQRTTFTDAERNVTIQLLENSGESYWILITTASE